jgi:hypothetical protein
MNLGLFFLAMGRNRLMALIKGVLSGLVAFLIAWIAILVGCEWQQHASRAAQGQSGLGATAGGWTGPTVLFLLMAVFGLGFWWGMRR